MPNNSQVEKTKEEKPIDYVGEVCNNEEKPSKRDTYPYGLPSVRELLRFNFFI